MLQREKNLILETLKTLLGSGSRTLQALGFEVLKRKRLFVPKEKVPHYIERTDRLRETMEVRARLILDAIALQTHRTENDLKLK